MSEWNQRCVPRSFVHAPLPSALTLHTVCAIESDYNPADNTSTIRKVVPIAGEYASSNGRPLEPVLTRLKNSASHGDTSKEGVRVELNGGRYPFDKTSGRSQKAIIEFTCDTNRTGLEGLQGDSREKIEYEDTKASVNARAEDEDKRGDDEKKGDDEKDDKDVEKEQPSLTFYSYNIEGEGKKQVEVLRMIWKTKYACEGQTEHDPSGSKSSHWGFFTWFLIM